VDKTGLSVQLLPALDFKLVKSPADIATALFLLPPDSNLLMLPVGDVRGSHVLSTLWIRALHLLDPDRRYTDSETSSFHSGSESRQVRMRTEVSKG
jgi:hypothetical protein